MSDYNEARIGEWIPTQFERPTTITILTDSSCAIRLRDRVAREITYIIDGCGGADECSELIPVFRWLNAVVLENEAAK
jgi:hypothetical protein